MVTHLSADQTLKASPNRRVDIFVVQCYFNFSESWTVRNTSKIIFVFWRFHEACSSHRVCVFPPDHLFINPTGGTAFNQVSALTSSQIKDQNHSTKGYLLAAGAAAFWGFSGVVTSYLLRRRQMRPDDLLVFRTGFAALILLGWLWLTSKHLIKIRLSDVPYFALLGLIGLVANQGFYYLALTKVSVGYALMLQYLAPIFLLAYGVLSKTERLTAGKIVSAILALSGAALMLFGQPGGIGQISWLGTFCAIGSGIGFAFYTAYGKHGLRRYDSRTMMAYAFFFAALIWLVIRPPWKIAWASYDASMWAFFFYLGAVATVLPFAFYLASLKHLEASRTSLTSILEPVVAATAAWIWLGQILLPLQIAGGLAVLVGVLLLQVESLLTKRNLNQIAT